MLQILWFLTLLMLHSLCFMTYAIFILQGSSHRYGDQACASGCGSHSLCFEHCALRVIRYVLLFRILRLSFYVNGNFVIVSSMRIVMFLCTLRFMLHVLTFLFLRLSCYCVCVLVRSKLAFASRCGSQRCALYALRFTLCALRFALYAFCATFCRFLHLRLSFYDSFAFTWTLDALRFTLFVLRFVVSYICDCRSMAVSHSHGRNECAHHVAVRILCELRFMLDALAFLIHAIVVLQWLRTCTRAISIRKAIVIMMRFASLLIDLRFMLYVFRFVNLSNCPCIAIFVRMCAAS